MRHHENKNEREQLESKINTLRAKCEKLKAAALAGDCNAIREQSICYQKIEVTKNRLNGEFGRTHSAAIHPNPTFTHVR